MQIELAVTAAGMIGLFIGLFLTLKTVGVLRPLNLERRYWILVAFISFFLLGYIGNILLILGLVELPFSTNLLVSLVFFGGAVYVVLVSVISLQLWHNVAGIQLSDEEARDLFYSVTGDAPPLMQFVSSDYSVKCNICENNVSFSLAGVVCTHATNITRGVEVQKGMGTTMVVVYPRHNCIDGIREIPVKLDTEFKYRSHGSARPI
jgi:hypothetical protein